MSGSGSRPAGRAAYAPESAAALGSFILSGIVFVRRPLPNNDGIHYLLAAEAYARDGFDAAVRVHPWPFFSILVANISGLFGVSVETAALGTGAFFIAVASATFVAVVRELGLDRAFLWLAVVVALCHPWLNRARDLIVRDGGVWAFSLLALLFLLRSGTDRRHRLIFGWAACSVAAAFFRPEASVFMIGGAVAILGRDGHESRQRLGLASFLFSASALTSAGAALWMARHPTHPDGFLSLAAFNRAAAALANSFPLPYGREYAPYILICGLLVIPLVKTLKACGIANFLLAAVGALSGSSPRSRFHRTAMFATTAAAFVPLYLQVIRLLFVESRYTVFVTLLISTWAPFGLGWLLAGGASAPRRAFGTCLVAALLLTLVMSLPFRPSAEEHVVEAAQWIRVHAGGARLHSNSLQIAYASGAGVDWNNVTQAQVHGALDGVTIAANGIWAVRIGPEERDLSQRLAGSRTFREVAKFVGTDGDEVLIFSCAAEVCVTGH